MRLSKRISALILTVIMMLTLIPMTAMAAGQDGWQKEEGSWYYYEDGVAIKNQWSKIGGKWYYFMDDGRMASNTIVPDKEIKHFYIVDKSGAMVTKAGWYSIKEEGSTIWFYVKKGGELTTGWKKISGKWYYFADVFGIMISGKFVPDGISLNDKLYFFNDDGSLKTNTWVKDSDGDWFYVDKNGNPVTGWKQISKKWYYFYKDGVMLADDWLTDPEDSHNYYHFGKNGVMDTNKWICEKEDGEEFWYYQLSNGVGAWEWAKIGGKWYYFDPNDYGAMVYSTTMEIEGKLYTFDEKGICLNP